MRKYSCCLILVLLQEIERAANKKRVCHKKLMTHPLTILFPFTVELCKDTKYNLGECRRVLQTVVKSHRSASSEWMSALP